MTDAFAAFRATVQDEVRRRMPDHVGFLGLRRDQLAHRQREQLRALVGKAIAGSPFHADRLAGIEPHRLELDDLHRLPVMTKAQMMADFDRVTTDRRLTRASVEAAIAATRDEPVVLFDRYIVLATGGTAGPRGVFAFDVHALASYVCGLQRTAVARGLVASRAAFVGAPSPIHATGFVAAFTRAGDVPLRFVPVPATLPFDMIVAKLAALAPDALFGYASMLVRLAAEQHAGRLAIAPAWVTSTSETLTEPARGAIRAAFGVPVLDTYATTEGLVGSSAPDDPVFTFNSDACIVELVDEHDRPVSPGSPSRRVLVTNLTNHLQPLLRYEIGDSFIEQPSDGHLRARVDGRDDDLLHLAGVVVHPLAIRAVMVKTAAVHDYQIRCSPHGVHAAVIAGDDLDRVRLARELGVALDAAGCAHVEVVVDAVADLPRDPRTGKLRRFVVS